jgi:hypothetical protein
VRTGERAPDRVAWGRAAALAGIGTPSPDRVRPAERRGRAGAGRSSRCPMLCLPPSRRSEAECERARMARDPAYDGRFFTGVRTTGASTAAPSARPGRPTCASTRAPRLPRLLASVLPAVPAGDGAVLPGMERLAHYRGTGIAPDRDRRTGRRKRDRGSARRVGVGARHLSRLFAQHVGASPAQVAHSPLAAGEAAAGQHRPTYGRGCAAGRGR